MDTQSFKTFSVRPEDVERDWYIVDATHKVVGRLASQIAPILRGKHKPTFTPHVDTGDFVIVINADQVRFTGNKETEKEYFRYTGYPGGDRTQTPQIIRDKDAAFLIERAVQGMLPKNKLGRKMLKKLKVYSGSDHPHQAQQPEELELDTR